MSTCPRCGANHVRKHDPRGRTGGDVDCTTWWCPRGHKWRELGPRTVDVQSGGAGGQWVPFNELMAQTTARIRAVLLGAPLGTIRYAGPIKARNAATRAAQEAEAKP